MKSLRSQPIHNASNIYSINLHSISLILCDEIFIDRLFAIDSFSAFLFERSEWMKEKSARVRWTQCRTSERTKSYQTFWHTEHTSHIIDHTKRRRHKANKFTMPIYSIGFSIFLFFLHRVRDYFVDLNSQVQFVSLSMPPSLRSLRFALFHWYWPCRC